ncbi:ABC transporter ATP-binding protein [Pseudomonas sp. RIT-To-2]|uniref:ABC transporter ATP-binding protein n=1 Tax=Pseudomonas sp. RIT-To-2 TaxID=3462541 RepID=UPI00241321BA
MSVQATPLLQVSNLHIDYHSAQGDVPGVTGISFELHAGEVLAVVGESGSGKSTTAAALVGLLAESARVRGGSIRLDGRELLGLGERQWQQVRGVQIGFVPQDPGLSLDPVKRVGAQLVEAMTVHGLPRAVARDRSLGLLREVGLPAVEQLARRYPHELSGGMRQRVLVAMGLANRPALVIADEPTSALDVNVQRQVLDCLQGLAQERQAAVILITHDLDVALQRADRVLVMHRGRVVESGAAAQVLRQPRHAYTRALLAAAPSAQAACVRQRSPAQWALAPILEVSGLHKSFATWRQPGPPAVDDVSFEVPRGGTTSLVGASGSGKSTTARLLLGLERADGGSVRFNGRELLGASRRDWRELRRQIQVVYQNPYASLNPRLSLAQIISEPLQAFAVGTAATRRQRVADLLAQVHVPATLIDNRPDSLSGGQRQRVAIARALALEPELVVLDEPLSALDVLVQQQILELLDELQQRLGLSYLFISHDLAVVRRISDRVVVMQGGRVVEQGVCEEVFSRPVHGFTQGLLGAAVGVPQL